jgi:hypothetical protein
MLFISTGIFYGKQPTTKQATNNHDRKYEGPALITLPTYDEKTDGRAFVILFTHMADTYKWSEGDTVHSET